MNNQSSYINGLFVPNLSDFDSTYNPVNASLFSNYLSNSILGTSNVYTVNAFDDALLSHYHSNLYSDYMYCGMYNNNLLLINKNVINDTFNFYYYLYDIDTHEIQYSWFLGNYLSSNAKTYIWGLVNRKCISLYDENYNLSNSFKNYINITTTPTDTFLHSKNSINYLPYLLYFSLPIILFVLAIKTFRRGLFR